jgi:hypothetical protein
MLMNIRRMFHLTIETLCIFRITRRRKLIQLSNKRKMWGRVREEVKKIDIDWKMKKKLFFCHFTVNMPHELRYTCITKLMAMFENDLLKFKC